MQKLVDSTQAVEDPKKIEAAILHLIANLPSPEPDINYPNKSSPIVIKTEYEPPIEYDSSSNNSNALLSSKKKTANKRLQTSDPGGLTNIKRYKIENTSQTTTITTLKVENDNR